MKKKVVIMSMSISGILNGFLDKKSKCNKFSAFWLFSTKYSIVYIHTYVCRKKVTQTIYF